MKKLAEKITNDELEHPKKNIGHKLFIELIQISTQFITTWLNESPSFLQKSLQSAKF